MTDLLAKLDGALANRQWYLRPYNGYYGERST
jgi:hypothetical protein